MWRARQSGAECACCMPPLCSEDWGWSQVSAVSSNLQHSMTGPASTQYCIAMELCSTLSRLAGYERSCIVAFEVNIVDFCSYYTHFPLKSLNMLQDTRGEKILCSFTLTWAAAGYYYQGLVPIRSEEGWLVQWREAVSSVITPRKFGAML